MDQKNDGRQPFEKLKLCVQLFKRKSHKMVKHTQTIPRQFADQLFEYV